ncbi:MAG: Crp/Fnr family transcriptional regulator [bacterium]
MDKLTHNGPVDCAACMFKMISCQFIKPDEFMKLQRSSLRVHFSKGEVILQQGMKSSHLLFLQSGIAKLCMENEAGKGLILAITRSPAMIGGADVINDGLNLYSVKALEDCDVCFIDYPMLLDIAMGNSLYMLKLMEMITGMFKSSILNFISLAHKQVNGRIADILIYLSETVYLSPSFTLSLTRKEVAEFAGCSTENVIHTLSKFHRDGIIGMTGKRIDILDAERLRKISKIG